VRASDLARLEQQSVRLSTGYARLDTVLGGGGVRLRQVTVLVNNAQHFQQVAHTLCANALRTNQQEPERNAIYIDQLGFFNI
jgi:RecA/RadA recombinase